MYDIIGDIHGEAERLNALLNRLGYGLNQGIYQHPERKAVFLGDFINKGPDTKVVLQTVMPMVEAGTAYAVAGNHELNLLGFFQKNAQGQYIRPHTAKNKAQLAPTFLAFDQEEALLKEYMEWMKTLPLFLELDGLRIVHGFWHQPSINYMQQQHPSCQLDDSLLHAMVPGSHIRQAVEELLVGIKLELPDSLREEAFKAKWWKIGKSVCYNELAIRPDLSLNNPRISFQTVDNEAYQYPEHAPPLFFGHYNLPENPRVLAHNYTCLDFSPEDKPLITAYRWDGETQLKKDKLVYV